MNLLENLINGEKIKHGIKLQNGNHDMNGDDEVNTNIVSDKKIPKLHQQQQQESNGNLNEHQNNTTSNCSTKSNGGGNIANGGGSRKTGGKLGSDGESEASPETSLSPLDVDSMEGKFLQTNFSIFKTHDMFNNNNL